MEKAIYGLAGVALGFLLTFFKEWWRESRKNKKNIEYLCIKISCMLEKFTAGCVEVVSDNGLFEGQYDQDGCKNIQITPPAFEPESIEVEWKSLPTNLMYEILNLPINIEAANTKIRGAFEYAASPPDYDEGFEERQYQYAILGIKAYNLASKLRKFSNIPEREKGDWDIIDYLQKDLEKTKKIRVMRSEQHEKMLKEISNN